MKFNYYYGSQADQFSFIRIPKVMLTESTFANLSFTAKVLYGVLLDRMSLSRKNGWFDNENRVFIIYQIGEIQADLGFSKKKAIDLLSELETFGLLEKKRRGHGLPNILYVKSFMDGVPEDIASTSAILEESIEDRSPETYTSSSQPLESRSAGTGSSDNLPMDARSPEIDSSGSMDSAYRSVENDTSYNDSRSSRGSEINTPGNDSRTYISRGSEINTSGNGSIAPGSVDFDPLGAVPAVPGGAEYVAPGGSVPDLTEIDKGKMPETAYPEVFKPTLLEESESNNSEVPKPALLEVPKSTLLEVPKSALLEVPKSTPLKSKTDINNTELSNIESNHILSTGDKGELPAANHSDEIRCDEMRSDWDPALIASEYRDLICENIGYVYLLRNNPMDRELLEGIVDLIQETVMCRSEEILIASNYYPTELVKSKFLKLNYSHIEYILTSFKANTTRVRNIRKYLLAALFNAPSTIDGFYKAEANYDVAQDFGLAN